MSTFRYEPPEPDRTIAIQRVQGPDLNLSRAVDHLKKGGLPVNPQTLAQIKQNFKDGSYQHSRDALMVDIKSDPALFAHYLRNLYAQGVDGDNNIDPLEALATLEAEKLEKLFDISPNDLSIHDISKMNRSQALRLQHVLVSSHTAEAIATKSEVSPGLAYSSAFLRQLALNLIAWNYPTIYSKALNNKRARNSDLMLELQKLLGTSPLQIISRIVADWNLNPALRRAVNPPLQRGAAEQAASDNMSIDEICRVSELYAKSHDRANFPEAEAEWRKLEPALKERFGGDFFEGVEEQIVKSVIKYEKSAPAVFTAPLLGKAQELLPGATAVGDLIQHNTFALRTRPEIRQAFETAYAQLKPGTVCVDAVRDLVDTIIPKAGFARGCLYLTSKDGMLLKPTLRVGDMLLSSYETLDHKQYHPIVDCLITTVPLKWQGIGVRGNQVSIIAGSLGALRHPGVLYLEMGQRLVEEPSERAVLYFHAIRKAFLDFLADGGE